MANGRDKVPACMAASQIGSAMGAAVEGGALSGTMALPTEWIPRVDTATQANPYTNLKLSLEARAHLVRDALEAQQERHRHRADTLGRILET